MTELEEASLAFQADRSTPSAMTTVGVALRLTMDVGNGFFIGLEPEFGGAVRAAPVRVMTSATEPVVARQDRYAQLVLLVGARRAIGRTQGAIELAGGVQAVPVTARYADDPDAGSEHEANLDTVMRPIIEPRLRVDHWLTPWITVGGFAGAQLPLGASSRGYALGVQIGVHLRAFDGGL